MTIQRTLQILLAKFCLQPLPYLVVLFPYSAVVEVDKMLLIVMICREVVVVGDGP